MSPEVMSALIAGVVSILVSLVSYFSVLRQIKNNRIAIERQLERQLTEKLYNLRIAKYPEAFTITAKLGKDDSAQTLRNIQTSLSEWKSGEVGLILSQKAKKAYYELNETIKKKPEKDGKFSSDQLQKIWKLRNRFRGELRRDLGLLFDEEDDQEIENKID